MPEQHQTQDSTDNKHAPRALSLLVVGLIGGLIGVGLGGLDRLVCQKKMENIEVTKVGKVTVEYGSGLIDGYYEDNSYYKDIPMIYITGHDKCINGDDLAGLKFGDKLAWIRYSSSSDKCDELKGFEKVE